MSLVNKYMNWLLYIYNFDENACRIVSKFADDSKMKDGEGGC